MKAPPGGVTIGGGYMEGTPEGVYKALIDGGVYDGGIFIKKYPRGVISTMYDIAYPPTPQQWLGYMGAIHYQPMSHE